MFTRKPRTDAPAAVRAITFNCSLKRDPGGSHTGALLEAVEGVLRRADAMVERVHIAAHDIPPGVQPDMTRHGWPQDDWPGIWQKVATADIIIIGTPIWLGEESSLCRRLIERLYAQSGQLNDKGQSIFYGKVGGAVVTGNEDGVKHCASTILYALSHLGCTIPPQADCGWIGEVGPGPSYADARAGGEPCGFDSDFTQQTTTIMAWNLVHIARMLKSAGGLPTDGNDRKAWKDGERFGFQNPKPIS